MNREKLAEKILFLTQRDITPSPCEEIKKLIGATDEEFKRTI